MNAVVIPPKKVAAKRAAPAPAPLTAAKNTDGDLLRQVSVHLSNAAFSEADGGLNSGRSTRLLRTAARLSGELGAQYWSGADGGARDEGYDIAALVIAALQVKQDRLDSYAMDEIKAVSSLLAELTEDQDVLEGALDGYDTQGLDTELSPALDPRIAEVVTALGRLGAMVDFAFEGRSEGDTGSTENNLLSLASDYLDSIADDVQSGYLLGDEDPGRGHSELIHRLGRFEHLIEAIGVVIGARYPANHREQARLDYLQQVLHKSDEIYNECECGKWEDALRRKPN